MLKPLEAKKRQHIWLGEGKDWIGLVANSVQNITYLWDKILIRLGHLLDFTASYRC